MPYQWQPHQDDGVQRLHLWPHRSLPRRGFVWFIGATAALIALPLLALLGSPVLWGILPFLLLALTAIWFALQRSYRDGDVMEELQLSRSDIAISHLGPKPRHGQRARQDWQGNPYWVKLELIPEAGPVPQYLILKGGDRVVELGRFLSPEERASLADDLRNRIAALR